MLSAARLARRASSSTFPDISSSPRQAEKMTEQSRTNMAIPRQAFGTITIVPPRRLSGGLQQLYFAFFNELARCTPVISCKNVVISQRATLNDGHEVMF